MLFIIKINELKVRYNILIIMSISKTRKKSLIVIKEIDGSTRDNDMNDTWNEPKKPKYNFTRIIK